MKKCINCGKKGLFIKLDMFGRCKTCQIEYSLLIEKQRNDERERALVQYEDFGKTFLELKTELNIDDESVEFTKLIEQIEDRERKCNKFIDRIKAAVKRSAFTYVVAEKCCYNKNDNSYFVHGLFRAFDIKVFIRRNETNDQIVEAFSKAIEENVQTIQRQLTHQRYVISNRYRYQQELDSIPIESIEYSTDLFEKLPVTELPEKVKFSRITTKSDYQKTGCFVAIDVETTGLNVGKNELIEVAAVRFEDWEARSVFKSFVKPQKEITDEITRLTGITNEMVQEAPSFCNLIPALNEFIGNYNIVGYNLMFDLKFLYKNGFDFTQRKRKYFDALEIAKLVLKRASMKWDKEMGLYDVNYDRDFDVYDFKLSTICKYYDIREESDAHRAASDAYATGLVFKKLVKEKMNI